MAFLKAEHDIKPVGNILQAAVTEATLVVDQSSNDILRDDQASSDFHTVDISTDIPDQLYPVDESDQTDNIKATNIPKVNKRSKIVAALKFPFHKIASVFTCTKKADVEVPCQDDERSERGSLNTFPKKESRVKRWFKSTFKKQVVVQETCLKI